MDPQATDSVHVEGTKPWRDVVLSLFRPSDHHVSADEIFEIITAGPDGPAAAEVCAAKGVTVPTYCVWKTKYRHLSLPELRTARRRALWRGRGLLGACVAVAVLGAGGIVYQLARAAHAAVTVAVESPSLAAVPPATITALPTSQFARRPDRGSDTLPTTAPSPAAPGRAIAALSAPPRPRTDGPPPISEPGYKIQVAAAQTLQEGRAVAARLAARGYPAYLARAIVSDAEVFRVRIGPFDTLSSAEEVASALHRDGYREAWIAR